MTTQAQVPSQPQHASSAYASTTGQHAGSYAQAAPASSVSAAAGPAAAPVTSHGLSTHTGKGLGRRSSVMLIAAVLAIVFMFQAWFSFPFIGKLLSAATASAGSTVNGIESALVGAIGTTVTMPELLGVGNGLGAVVDFFNQQMSLYSSYGALDTATLQTQQMIGAFSTASIAIKIFFALWVICLVGIVAGIALKLFRGYDVVLFFALAATAVMALICIIGAFALGGIIEGAISDIAALSSSSSGTDVALSMLSPFMAPGYGAVVTLALGVVGVLSSLVLKDEH